MTFHKGGGVFFYFVNFFPNILKIHFFLFLKHFGHIFFFVLGGAKIFRDIAKGGRKIFAASLRGAKIFCTSIILDSLGKIKGHVKNILRK